MITRSIECMIKVIIYLYRNPGVHSSLEIAEYLGMNHVYLVKVIQPLVRMRIIKSRQGTLSGFMLNIDVSQVTLFDIVNIVSPPRISERDDRFQLLHDVLDKTTQEYIKSLKKHTLKDLTNE